MADRAGDLVSQLTVDEKIGQLQYNAPAIPRLGIPAYNWWNEALHGVARTGRATVFPQAIGLAATFDDELALRVATAISDEARAKYNAAISLGNRARYAGLTFWTPNVNIFRDPRWGRGQETYGEDPFLTSRMGAAFVRGLQGDHPRYLKSAACAKHYAVHSGPEADRHVFDAVPSQKDFAETYLPAFEVLVKEADVEAVMCAYNRTFGEPCCGSPLLLQDILRDQWGFDGHIVSDCWALVDFHATHKVTENGAQSAAKALKSGVNVNCGSVFNEFLKEAFDKGLVTEAEIDAALTKLLETRFELGLFDPQGSNPYDAIPASVINSPEHRQLSREAAVKSIVMLKNDGVLPLKKNIRSLGVVGPHATSSEILLANYYGMSSNLTTVLEGITAKVHPGTTVDYKYAQSPFQENINPIDWSTGDAMDKDAVIAVMGISGLLEGEEGESVESPTKGDRLEIGLPEAQINYLKKLRKAGDKPLVLVLTGGSPITLPDEVLELVDAALFIWYPGEEGGHAVADVIFGDVSPSGRLPLTFPASLDDLPPYEDYSMQGRTYKFMEKTPAFPFGFGLSYTTFRYSDLQLDQQELAADGSMQVSVEVTNTGEMASDEVVQLYLSYPGSKYEAPLYDLKSFKRVHLKPGETRTVRFNLAGETVAVYDKEGKKVHEPGAKTVHVGGSLPGERSRELGAAPVLSANFRMKKVN